MKYTVVWGRSAARDLAAIWIAAADRHAVASAADTIDGLLADDPHLQGESRFGRIRVLLLPPLGVYFEVLEEDRLARVLALWRLRSTRRT